MGSAAGYGWSSARAPFGPVCRGPAGTPGTAHTPRPARFRAELIVPVLIAGIALTVALTLFLSEYLLYRYDHDDAAALEEP